MKHVLMILVCREYLMEMIDFLTDCCMVPTVTTQYNGHINRYLLTCEQYSEFDEIVLDGLDTWRKDTELTEFRYTIS